MAAFWASSSPPSLFSLRNKTDPFLLGDLLAIVSPIGLFFGRLANFINGELWGRVSDVAWAMVFPRGGAAAAPSQPALPGLLRGHRAVRHRVSLCGGSTDGRRRPGLLSGVFSRGYGVARIVGEFSASPMRISAICGGRSPWACCCRVPLLAHWRLADHPCLRPAPCIVTVLNELRDPELGRLIARRIALTGPISLADFMAEALGHPRLGYYRTALPVGAAGDFTRRRKSPRCSASFRARGCAERWLAMGRPARVRAGRARARTRHPDGRRLARHARRAGLPRRRSTSISSRSTSNLRALQETALAVFKPTWHDAFRRRARRARCCWSPTSSSTPCRCASSNARARGWVERMVGLATTARRLRLGAGARRHAVRGRAARCAGRRAGRDLRGRGAACRRDRRAPGALRRGWAPDRRLWP